MIWHIEKNTGFFLKKIFKKTCGGKKKLWQAHIKEQQQKKNYKQEKTRGELGSPLATMINKVKMNQKKKEKWLRKLYGEKKLLYTWKHITSRG
jgi:acyl-[acyl carrier protein]--UDP-N-acetylglucosamine O-acyltransferase